MNSSFLDRLVVVQEQISDAAHKAARTPSDVRLLAASKTRLPEEVDEAVRAGLTLFGENRIQEAKQKIPLCSSAAEWHFIGHLQTNKVRDAVAFFSTIQTVDSLRLAEEIGNECGRQNKSLDILLEVNVSGERSKFGISPDQLPSLLEKVNAMTRLRVCGFMTMAPFAPEPEKARPFFAALRECRDRLQSQTGLHLPELSMGMSHDFEAAIKEGSTKVRIGSLLFGERQSAMREGNG